MAPAAYVHRLKPNIGLHFVPLTHMLVPSPPTQSQARCEEYRTATSLLASLLDPINSQPGIGGGLRKPPTEWYDATELEEAAAKCERLGTGIAALMPPGTLPSGVTPTGFGIDARLAFEQLCANGFAERIIGYCSVPGNDGPKWAAGDRRRCGVTTVLRRDPSTAALAAVADRVLSQHATVCSIDRFWSELGNMFPAQRCRLAIEKADKMMLVRNMCRLRDQSAADDDEVERAFWISQALDD